MLLRKSFVTPKELFYVRNHGPTPEIDPASYRLTVSGLVERSLELALEEIKNEFPKEVVVAAIHCAGNRRDELMEVAGIPGEIPWNVGAIGNARWGGVRLREVLMPAEVEAEARHAAFLGLDEPKEGDSPNFGGSIPIKKAISPDVLLAYEMNDEPLPLEQGPGAPDGKLISHQYFGGRGLRPKTPTSSSFRLVCGALYAFVVSLAGCGGEPSHAPSEGSGEIQEEETTEEVGRLAVRDAVGQMFIVSMDGTEPNYYIEKMIRERNIGGVLLFGHNMESEEQTKELTDSLQRLSIETEPAIPLFVAVDHEGGEVQSAPWVSARPSAAEVGRRADPEEAWLIAEEIGRELRRGGVNTDFAPVVDTEGGAAIGSRSYGNDPALVGRMGAAAVEGFKQAGVVSAAKHFPNHGPAIEDSHVSRPRIEHDLKQVTSEDLPPFQAAIEAGVPMVMLGHLVYPTLDPENPASLSPEATRLLREELGFEGVIVTDDLAMEGAKRGGTSTQAAVAAVTAGADLLVVSSLPEEQAAAYDAIVAAVESGEISRERIETSVERIKNIKNRYPLYSPV